MSQQMPHLNDSLFENLRLGKALTESQLSDFLSCFKNSDEKKSLVNSIECHTSQFLHSLALSADFKISQKGSTSSFGVIIPQVASLITTSLEPSITTICEYELKKDTPLAFYLSLYSTLCIKHEIKTASMIPVLLSLLANSDQNICDLSVFLLISLVRKNPAFQDQVLKCLQETLDRNSPELSPTDFAILATSLEVLFPIIPDAISKLYISEPCKQAFLYQGSLLDPEKDAKDSSRAETLLRVLSSSCINEVARKFNTENYLSLLIAGSALDSSDVIQSLSLLCIVKLWNFSTIEKQISMDTVFTKTLTLFVTADSSSTQSKCLLEALAYLSLGSATKAALRANEEALEKLILSLETSQDSSVIYGCMSVLSNLCKVKAADQDKDTNTLDYLKSMATDKTNANDSEESILAFNRALVEDHKLVSTLAALKQVNESSIIHVINVLQFLSTKQEIDVQREIVSQGGLNIIIKYLVEHSKFDKDSATTSANSNEVQDTRLQSLRTLATLCRSVNPALAFSKYDVKTCVPFLIELMGPDLSAASSASFVSETILGPADKLCSLLALTNLSSLPDTNLHSLVVSRCFEQHLKNLMIDSTLLAVQKATWELINNLIACPLMLAKFFNPESSESRKNLDLLVKMLHSQNEALQIVIAGLIANATMEFDLVSSLIMTQKTTFNKLRQIIASIFKDQALNDDLILRVAHFLRVLTIVAKDSDKVALQTLERDADLKSGIKNVVVSTKNPEIMSLLRDVIQVASMTF